MTPNHRPPPPPPTHTKPTRTIIRPKPTQTPHQTIQQLLSKDLLSTPKKLLAKLNLPSAHYILLLLAIAIHLGYTPGNCSSEGCTYNIGKIANRQNWVQITLTAAIITAIGDRKHTP